MNRWAWSGMAETTNGHQPAAVVRRAGLAGGGVIGGGWAARWVLAGVDVAVFDPAPGAEAVLSRLIANATTALQSLHGDTLPTPGRWQVVATIEEAADGADIFHESVPERLELKQSVLAQVDAAAEPHTLICSSTSGLLPSLLQADMAHPDRFLVAHPFNPVYLLPLVEICGGEATNPAAVEAAYAAFTGIGMKPLVVRREVEGFIADRLLEALWREALWLVADGVATTEEIDDAIRYGAGLRWASMGTMLTYRIAGGDGGMRHFMGQFGPTLQWPWTHLTEVPELDEALMDRIAEQSDSQAGGVGVGELERIRDACLVAVLDGLRSVPYGAGVTVREHDARLATSRTSPSDPHHPSRAH